MAKKDMKRQDKNSAQPVNQVTPTQEPQSGAKRAKKKDGPQQGD